MQDRWGRTPDILRLQESQRFGLEIRIVQYSHKICGNQDNRQEKKYV
jgi:hypothetical protein